MLVYANQMVLNGDGAEEAVLKAVGGWLRIYLGFVLRPEQLKTQGEYVSNPHGIPRSSVKIFATDEQAPRLYSWILTSFDKEVYGRQWSTELGLKISGDSIEFSCVLKANERSPLVSTPIEASRPRVIGYVFSNIQKSPNADFDNAFIGRTIKKIGDSIDSYHAFLAEIEHPKRDHPIVLVSPCTDGEYLIEIPRLRNQLIGLAQVVQVDPDFNSYQMEEILGNQWSAWNGAVNIIHTPKSSGFVRGRYFLAEEIKEFGDAPQSRTSSLLAWVANDTNITQMRKHIRPEGVMLAVLRRKIEANQERASKMNPDELRKALADQESHYDKFFDELADENSQLETTVADLRSEIKDSKDESKRKEYTIQNLKAQLEISGEKKSSNYNILPIFELARRKDEPTPEKCLEVINSMFGENCVILDTAIKSAQASNRFSHGRQLFDMLRKLVTEYRQILIEGGGDAKARGVFTNSEYAAKESETLRKNKDKKRARTFNHNGKDIEMFQHLKIGTADDITHTIRVHFHWDADINKIIIGYCGEHLPISSH